MKQERVVDLIRREIGGMNQAKFCRLFSVNPTVLSDVLRGHKPPTAQLCALVNVEKITVTKYRKADL